MQGFANLAHPGRKAAQCCWHQQHQQLGAVTLIPAQSRPAVACRSSRRQREANNNLHSKVAFTEPAVVPTELLRSDYAEQQMHTDAPLTVYSCRMSTGYGRGAALSDSYSGVNLCLIGKDGRSVMHRISPVNDPQEARHDIELMCQIIDDESVGADCSTSLAQNEATGTAANSGSSSSNASSKGAPGSGSYTLPPKPPPAPRPRFQEGTVDEFVFLAPELGPLAGVLVGTEHASWLLDEVQVSSSRTHHVDRFVCRQLLGSQPGQGAVFLSPVPPGAVVYGTGEAQVMLNKEQANALHVLNMDAYEALKQRLLHTTFLLTASGTWVAGLAAGLDGAVPFALGGFTGLVYQWLLQQGVDSIVSTVQHPPRPGTVKGGSERPLQATATLDDPSVFDDTAVEVSSPDGTVRVVGQHKHSSLLPGSTARKIVSGPAARIAFLGAAVAVIYSMVVDPEGVETAQTTAQDVVTTLPMALSQHRQDAWRLLVAFLGFMTYKVALISVSITTPPPLMDKVTSGAAKSSRNNGSQN